MSQGEKEILHSLTSLRFVAAFAILLQHAESAFLIKFGDFISVPLFWGVNFFFVLSGFILTYVYEDAGGRINKRRFFISRVARIWPLHILTLIFFLMVVPMWGWFPGPVHPYTFEVAAANVLLLHAWVPLFGVYFSLNAVSWSISTEALFYMVFPWLASCWSATWHWKTLLVFVMSTALVVLASELDVPPLKQDGDLMSITAHGISYISPFVRVFEFSTGMCAAVLYRRIKSSSVRLHGLVWWGLEVGLLMALPKVWGFINGPVADVFRPGTVSGVFAANAMIAPVFAVIVVVFAVGRGPLSRWLLSWRPFVLLGEASFSLYLVHEILLWSFKLNAGAFSQVPPVAQFLTYFVVAVSISFVLYFLVERPARMVLVRFADGRMSSTSLQVSG